jgi:hypothetical protein
MSHLTTGEIALAGIMATLAGALGAAALSGRRQTANLIRSISAEDGRAKLADRRDRYARFLGACFGVINTRSVWQAYRQTVGASSEEVSRHLVSYNTAAVAAAVADAEMAIISEGEVRCLAHELYKAGPICTTATDPQSDAYNCLRERLLDAMRADLETYGSQTAPTPRRVRHIRARTDGQ